MKIESMSTICSMHLFGVVVLLFTSAQLAGQFNDFQTLSAHPKAREVKTLAQVGAPVQFHSVTFPELVSKDWEVDYYYRGKPRGIDHGNDLVDSIKQEKTELKLLNTQAAGDPQTTSPHDSNYVLPKIEADFTGNHYNLYTPLDNNIAVSNQGLVVSVVNSSIAAYDQMGRRLFETGLGTFFQNLGLPGYYFDPTILFDPVEERFILVVLNGNSSVNSKVVIAFSSSSDPRSPWINYIFEGDPLNEGNWFDFPRIGISEEEIYVCGNLYNDQHEWQHSMIYMIEKKEGFNGGPLSHVYWPYVKDVYGYHDFNLMPASYGFDANLSPGMLFVSTDFAGGTETMVYWTTGTLRDNPRLMVASVSDTWYALSGNAFQRGTTDILRTNDCRSLSGYVSDNALNFVFNTDYNFGYTGIFLCRILLPELTATWSVYGLPGYDYAYPSIVPFTDDPSDNTSLIGFMKSGADIFPEIGVISSDTNFVWSPEIQVRRGEAPVDILIDTIERWGDYSGICRFKDRGHTKFYISGSYGTQYGGVRYGFWDAWIARITKDSSYKKPVADFITDVFIAGTGDTVQYIDQSFNGPTQWSWTFPGARDTISNEKNPRVIYDEPGFYGARLKVSNPFGVDSVIRGFSVWIDDRNLQPVADFEAEKTEIFEGDTVRFFDLTSNDPIAWSWYLPGSSQVISRIQHPVVVYDNEGTYNVSLDVTNSYGRDIKSKQAYIRVNKRVPPPVAQFIANPRRITQGGEVRFTDRSGNSPTEWHWIFEGGIPAVSTEQHPRVSYDSVGLFDVKLSVANAGGMDSLEWVDCITVDSRVVAPVADFDADRSTIMEGDSIQFVDLSANGPETWSWVFEGGKDAASDQQNPAIVYEKAGVYDVFLTVSNSAGSDSIRKDAFINVEKKVVAPVAEFVSDTQRISPGGVVQYYDRSSYEPTEFRWSFPGGVPNISELKDPIIIYPDPGVYDVSLIVTNQAGSDVLTKKNYIQVEFPTSSSDRDVDFQFIVSPNPASIGERIRLQISLLDARIIDVFMLDQKGNVAKKLIQHRMKSGENIIEFTPAGLPPGTYYIMAQDLRSSEFCVEKLILMDN